MLCSLKIGGFVIVANVFCDRAGELPKSPGKSRSE